MPIRATHCAVRLNLIFAPLRTHTGRRPANNVEVQM
jgi:hypothetical protein